jgi:hypothetical protein
MKKTFAVALVSVLLLAGCAARGVRVAELKGEPGRYATKSVSVNGVVTSSWGLGRVGFGLVPFEVYNVDDGSGEITVVSRSGRGAPTRGTKVQVKGRITEFAVLGGRSVGLHLQEEDRKVKS